MEKICPEYLFDGAGDLQVDKVLIHERGKILSIEDRANFEDSEVHFFKGIVCPGFVNTHCHLELSHMKGKANSGTGLLPFLNTVVGFRDIEYSEIISAIQKADEEMYKNGIVAVGDISNKLDTAEIKEKSQIAYHTFVEMFDFMNKGMTQSTINQYTEVFQGQARTFPNKISYAPHAPYTVSTDLFQYIKKQNSLLDNVTVSIHNQETIHEDELFQTGNGGFIEFYKGFGINMKDFVPTGKSAIHYALENMNPDKKTLFVHNTCSKTSDIKAAHAWGDEVYWATCPNANLYIENRLPNYQIFLDQEALMTIGTDSLTSNWQLSILEEIKTINRLQSYIPISTLLKWATSNGARALGYEDSFGKLLPGMSPGILLINCTVNNSHVDLSKASVVRLA